MPAGNGEGRPSRPLSPGGDGALAPGAWRRLERVFHEAAALPADQRKDLLDSLTAAEPELRARVESLLQADARSSSCIDRVVREACLDFFGRRDPEKPGR